MTDVRITIVIPTRDRKEKLLRLLASIAASSYPQRAVEVIVVDNASVDGSAEGVTAAFPDVTVLREPKNLWSAEARNIGAAKARGEFVFFVDDDNVLDPNCIERLATAMVTEPDLGVAAPLMLLWDRPNVLWCAGGMISGWGLLSHPRAGRDLHDLNLPERITADFFPNAYMVRKTILDGGLMHDAVNFPHNWNEPDFCRRISAAGYEMATITSAVTRHDVGYGGPLTRIGIEKTFDQARARVLFRRKHMNDALQWLKFFLVVLPLSSVIYLRAFATQKTDPFDALVKAYVDGTLAGFRKTL